MSSDILDQLGYLQKHPLLNYCTLFKIKAFLIWELVIPSEMVEPIDNNSNSNVFTNKLKKQLYLK